VKPKTIGLMLVAVTCGLIAAFLASNLGPAPPESAVPVVVAKVPIGQGALISADMVQIKLFTKDTAPVNAVAKIEEVVGKQVVRVLDPGTPITPREWNVSEQVTKNLPRGMRAMTLRLNLETGIAGFLLPGARVDILCFVPDSKDSRIKKSKVFLQNVQVLAINHLLTPPEGQGVVTNPVAATVAVTPKDAERLVWVQSGGNLSLVLRRPDEGEQVETPGAVGPFDPQIGEPENQPTVTVLVAKKKLEAPQMIRADEVDDYFDAIPMPAKAAPPDALRSKDDVKGRVIAHLVVQGAWISREHLLEGEKALTGVVTVMRVNIGAQRTEYFRYRDAWLDSKAAERNLPADRSAPENRPNQ